MNDLPLKTLLLCSVLVAPTALLAQTAATTEEPVEAAEAVSDEALMTAEELQTLVGPIALYPDTLLIQVLVAATYPLDVVKADRLVKENEGATPEEIKPLVEAEGWDESVSVLAEAFPEVLSEMALHVEWTETIGTAMLAQSDDVMEAVQNRREAANEAGTLVSGEEQTVEVAQADNGSETIIIQPTDPEIVYVPQYDSNVVYVQDNNSTDLLTAGLVGFGAFVLMDAIFDNDDPWNDYWGCRSCGGWGGGPIYARPGAGGINVDGNVNIGNNVGNGVGNNIRDNDGGWKPEQKRQNDAKKKISNKRGEDGKTKLPVNKGPNRGDDMRSNLSSKTGAKDISRSAKPREAVGGANLAAGAAAGGLAAGGLAAASSNKKKAAVNRTGAAPAKAKAKNAAPAKKKAAAKKAPAAKKTGVAQKAKTSKKPAAKRKVSKPTAMKKRPSSHKAGSGGSRGRASSGGRKRR